MASHYSLDDSHYSLDRLETLCHPWLPHASIFLGTNSTEAIHNISALCVIFWNKIGPLINEIIRPFVCNAQNNEIWDVQTFCSAEWMWADKNIFFSIPNLNLPFQSNILKSVNKKVIISLSTVVSTLSATFSRKTAGTFLAIIPATRYLYVKFAQNWV